MSSKLFQREFEKWVVDSWLPKIYGVPFRKQKLIMQNRGVFVFDAVSEDMKIIGNINTTEIYTLGGKPYITSKNKDSLRSDCLMLALRSAEVKLIIFRDTYMHSFALNEQSEGRLPLDIKFCLAELPDYLKHD